MKKKYDSTVARMAGNIAAGMLGRHGLSDPVYSSQSFATELERISLVSVKLARAIVAEVERTEPEFDAATQGAA